MRNIEKYIQQALELVPCNIGLTADELRALVERHMTDRHFFRYSEALDIAYDAFSLGLVVGYKYGTKEVKP